jgi:hypothetical protein
VKGSQQKRSECPEAIGVAAKRKRRAHPERGEIRGVPGTPTGFDGTGDDRLFRSDSHRV